MATPLHDRAQKALGGLIALLTESLLEDGSFLLRVSPSADFTNSEGRMSAFALGLALRSIAKIPQAESAGALLAERLKREVSADGSWNYWLRSSSDAKRMPFPDDLDSTSICLQAVSLFDPDFLTGDVLANYAKLLMTAEVAQAGPYATWLVASSARRGWQDVDPVVNANIASVLSSQDRALSGLDEYVLAVLKDTTALSPYYPSRVAFISALSLADRETFSWFVRAEAQLLFLQAENPFDRAMLAVALVNAHADGAILEEILETCLRDAESGACVAPYPVCLDRMKGNEPYYAGAKEITLSASAGAIFALTEAIHIGEQLKPDERMMTLQESVKRLAVIGGVSADSEKSMFPYLVASSLDREEELTDDFFLRVCLAYTFGTLDELSAAKEVFMALGYRTDGEEVRAFEEYLRHFLMAKQLTEDARTWEEDLRQGKMTVVNEDVVARLKSKGFNLSSVDWMDALHVEMQKIYWSESLERACSRIFSHVEMAGEVCEDLPDISRPFWRALVSKYGRSARLALEERNRALAFLKSMKL
ncbi:MAG: hypothetical protein WC802_04075 [Patescibacteria group bacterium]|jgi:hypothetical protein